MSLDAARFHEQPHRPCPERIENEELGKTSTTTNGAEVTVSGCLAGAHPRRGEPNVRGQRFGRFTSS